MAAGLTIRAQLFRVGLLAATAGLGGCMMPTGINGGYAAQDDGEYRRTADAPVMTGGWRDDAGRAQNGRADALYWIDQANGFAEAVGDAQPDVGFRLGATRGWAWIGNAGEAMIVEDDDAALVQYFFAPGGTAPYLVRHTYASFAFDGQMLVARYDARGRVLDRQPNDSEWNQARRLQERGRRLFSAMRQQRDRGTSRLRYNRAGYDPYGYDDRGYGWDGWGGAYGGLYGGWAIGWQSDPLWRDQYRRRHAGRRHDDDGRHQRYQRDGRPDGRPDGHHDGQRPGDDHDRSRDDDRHGPRPGGSGWTGREGSSGGRFDGGRADGGRGDGGRGDNGRGGADRAGGRPEPAAVGQGADRGAESGGGAWRGRRPGQDGYAGAALDPEERIEPVPVTDAGADAARAADRAQRMADRAAAAAKAAAEAEATRGDYARRQQDDAARQAAATAAQQDREITQQQQRAYEAPRYEPPASRNEPPAPRYEAPAARYEAPAPRYEPPAARNDPPPAPRYDPPAPRPDPPARVERSSEDVRPDR